MKSHFRIFFLLVTILTASNSFAQRFKAGFTTAFVISDINGANSAPNRKNFHKVGFAGGLAANARVGKKTLLQFEIVYIQKGSMQPPDSLNNGYYKIALDYVEIPLFVRQQLFFNWKGKRINKVDLELGASYGKLIRKNVIGNTNYQLSGTDDLYNTNDVSILAGLDFNFTKNVCFNFRYSNSVIPAIKRNALRAGFVSQTFNRGNNMVFQLGFKFLFGAKEKTTSEPAPNPVAP